MANTTATVYHRVHHRAALPSVWTSNILLFPFILKSWILLKPCRVQMFPGFDSLWQRLLDKTVPSVWGSRIPPIATFTWVGTALISRIWRRSFWCASGCASRGFCSLPIVALDGNDLSFIFLGLYSTIVFVRRRNCCLGDFHEHDESVMYNNWPYSKGWGARPNGPIGRISKSSSFDCFLVGLAPASQDNQYYLLAGTLWSLPSASMAVALPGAPESRWPSTRWPLGP